MVCVGTQYQLMYCMTVQLLYAVRDVTCVQFIKEAVMTLVRILAIPLNHESMPTSGRS